MLRVGLTGGLGSGKSTVAGMFAELGAVVFSADEIGRSLMQPGERVYDEIARVFGAGVMRQDGSLDRGELARLAFAGGRVEELNAIVHPATIARQEELARAVFARDAEAVVVVESALIFETLHGGGWRERFERMVLVAVPEERKVARFVERSLSSGAQPPGSDVAALEAEARRRLGRMIPDVAKAKQCDFVIVNDGSLVELRVRVRAVWDALADGKFAGA